MRMQKVQQRDAEHTVESVNSYFAVSPVAHRSPAKPITILKPSKDFLNLLLAAVTFDYLFFGPVEGAAHENRFRNCSLGR